MVLYVDAPARICYTASGCNIFPAGDKADMSRRILLDLSTPPRVLLLGNGILRLKGGGDWSQLLNQLRSRDGKAEGMPHLPFAMQPEAMFGANVEEVTSRALQVLRDVQPPHALKKLLSLPFDAVLTTNYTYEIEQVITGKPWTDAQRRRAFLPLDGNSHARYNTCICSLVPRRDGSRLPVFHMHGEYLRKQSLVLSYYSYANSVSNLIALNRYRANSYTECQEAGKPMECRGWLDYFLMGDVYAVGFGFDLSEFDVWWAIERKAREHARHGTLHAYMIEPEEKQLPQAVLFQSMQVDLKRLTPDHGYPAAYEEVLKSCRASLSSEKAV